MTPAAEKPRHSLRTTVALLTSPRVAVALLVFLGGYAVFATSAKPSWAFRDPVFLACVALLCASTAVCASRRTRVAVRSLRRTRLGDGSVSGGTIIPLDPPAASGSLVEAASALRSLGMSVRADGERLVAVSNRVGRLGSPLFHWCLALLFAVAALGSASRSVAYMDLAEGEGKPTIAASYAAPAEAGPLSFGGREPLEVSLRRIEQRYPVGGLDRGPVPMVEVRRGGEVVASGAVYPNSPLKVGTLTIHRADVGLAARIRVARPGARVSSGRTLYLAQAAGEPKPTRLTLPPQATAEKLDLAASPAGGGKLGLELLSGPAAGRSWHLAEGEVASLPDGTLVRVVSLGRYARLGLVSDWSAPLIYALLAAGTLGVALTVFWPPRTVVVALSAAGEPPSLVVSVFAARNDPAFAGRVHTALASSVAPPTEAVVA